MLQVWPGWQRVLCLGYYSFIENIDYNHGIVEMNSHMAFCVPFFVDMWGIIQDAGFVAGATKMERNFGIIPLEANGDKPPTK